MNHYLLFYETCDNYVERRAAFRELHLKHASAASERGELVLAGAFGDPAEGAVLLFRGESPAVAESFAQNDPYVLNGLIPRWRVREWNTVVGKSAAHPVRPATSSRVVRSWKGSTTTSHADQYLAHVTTAVFPRLRRIPGFLSGRVLRRSMNDRTEFLVMTEWSSLDAIRAFAGNTIEKAVIDPLARAWLSDADEAVSHYEVVSQI